MHAEDALSVAEIAAILGVEHSVIRAVLQAHGQTYPPVDAVDDTTAADRGIATGGAATGGAASRGRSLGAAPRDKWGNLERLQQPKQQAVANAEVRREEAKPRAVTAAAAATTEAPTTVPCNDAPAIPAGWEVGKTPDGRNYYIDCATLAAHWQLPPVTTANTPMAQLDVSAAPHSASAAPHSAEQELRYEIESIFGDQATEQLDYPIMVERALETSDMNMRAEQVAAGGEQGAISRVAAEAVQQEAAALLAAQAAEGVNVGSFECAACLECFEQVRVIMYTTSNGVHQHQTCQLDQLIDCVVCCLLRWEMV